MVERSFSECNSYETHNIYPSLNDQQFRLNKISEVRDYFIGETKERELLSKRLSKYIASFDYFNKSLIVLTQQLVAFLLHHLQLLLELLYGAPVEIASASFSLAFSISTGTVKKLLKQQEIKRKSIIKLLC